jgi:hypothetical protein
MQKPNAYNSSRCWIRGTNRTESHGTAIGAICGSSFVVMEVSSRELWRSEQAATREQKSPSSWQTTTIDGKLKWGPTRSHSERSKRFYALGSGSRLLLRRLGL